jgi:hypothetical protein
MLDWLIEMTSTQLAEQATTYAARSGKAVGASTREAFDRLARQCQDLAAVREVEEKRALAEAGRDRRRRLRGDRLVFLASIRTTCDHDHPQS